MFNTGELIVYGNTGVCRVVDVKEINMSRDEGTQLYYVLKPLYQNYTVSTPVDNKKVFMRHIISREEAERLVEMIPSIRAEAYHNRSPQRLAEHYKESISTHDCEDLVELTMSIYAKKQFVEQQKRKFGAVDEKFMRRAEELLFGELAAALDITRDEVRGYIEAKLAKSEE
ncbi:MAG: CarD family transcriptional regulator [Oscillospiraceae bacterium]|nr:CarD family transcriptional regulator [Oscillospiraceae bacterium]